MALTKNLLILALICTSFFAIRAQEEVVDTTVPAEDVDTTVPAEAEVVDTAVPMEEDLNVEVTAEDLEPFADVLAEDDATTDATARRLTGAPGAQDCITITREQLRGKLVRKLADHVNDILVGELIEAKKLPWGRYNWKKVSGCVSPAGYKGLILKLDIIEQMKCKDKCFEIQIVILITKDLKVKLIDIDVSPVDCKNCGHPERAELPSHGFDATVEAEVAPVA